MRKGQSPINILLKNRAIDCAQCVAWVRQPKKLAFDQEGIYGLAP
jgi:hypothetical protein